MASEKTVVPRRPLLLGFLSVEDPETVDDDLRRPQDPVDRRMDVTRLHPDVRDQGVGGALRDVAERHGQFESHSDVRTDAGSRRAAGAAKPFRFHARSPSRWSSMPEDAVHTGDCWPRIPTSTACRYQTMSTSGAEVPTRSPNRSHVLSDAPAGAKVV